MADDTGSVTLDQPALQTFGNRLGQQFEKYKTDRYPLEQQWMKNVRQYRGIYDPEVHIRPFGSTAYPKFTRKWVNGTISRLMQMLFPQTEHNWDIKASVIPELPRVDLEALLNELQDAAGQAGTELSEDQIEEQVKKLADARCDRMRQQMRDQLDEIDYVALARKVVASGVLYGTGLLSGPLIKEEVHRSWRMDVTTKRYKVLEKKRLVPWFDSESIWDWYPDLSAKGIRAQDGYYMRRVMSREQLRRLADRPDFLAGRIVDWLKTNPEGNYKELYWELEIRVDGDRKYAQGLNTRKYELLEWWGYVSGIELKAAGVTVPDDQLSDQFEANVWQIGNTVIKCIVNPTQSQRRPLHQFTFEEDDMNSAGVGLPQVCRDSQLAICESSRMMLDNASVIATPSKLIKLGLLLPGHPLDSRPYMDWYQDPDAGDNTQDAVKNLSFDSHLTELQAIMQLFKSIGEEEVSLPPITSGDTSQGGSEGLRTQGNMSMALGNASLPIRDTVRNFDLFTESVMGGLYDWNMEFNEDPKIKGDFGIVTRGSTSLMAKEVRGQHLMAFGQTIQPEEREFMDWKKNLTERMLTLDLVPSEHLASDEVVQANREAKRKEQEEMAQLQRNLLNAEIRNTFAQAIKNVSQADKNKVGASVEVYKSMMAGLDQIANQHLDADEQTRKHISDARDHVSNLFDLSIRKQAAEKPAAAAAT